MGRSGRPVLRVREADSGQQNPLLLYNQRGNVAAVIMSTGGRGFIAVSNGKQSMGSDGSARAVLTADSNGDGELLVGDKGPTPYCGHSQSSRRNTLAAIPFGDDGGAALHRIVIQR